MKVVESVVDSYLYPEPENGRVGDIKKFQKAFSLFSRNKGRSDSVYAITNAFLHRTNPSNGGFTDLLNTIDDIDVTIYADEASDEQIKQWVDKLGSIAKGHERFSEMARPIDVQVTPEITLSIAYGLVSHDFEAVGGLHFFMQDGPYQIPLYALRGNPEFDEEGAPIFSIRAVQPWAGDSALISSFASEDYWLVCEDGDTPKENISLAQEVIHTRRKKVDLLEERLNRGSSVTDNKKKLREHDIILLLGISYLQGLGVTKIRGIKQDVHPDKGALRGVFDYDQFFQRWTKESDQDPVHPWILHRGAPSGYVPEFLHLPAAMRLACMKAYETTKQMLESKSVFGSTSRRV